MALLASKKVIVTATYGHSRDGGGSEDRNGIFSALVYIMGEYCETAELMVKNSSSKPLVIR